MIFIFDRVNSLRLLGNIVASVSFEYDPYMYKTKKKIYLFVKKLTNDYAMKVIYQILSNCSLSFIENFERNDKIYP